MTEEEQFEEQWRQVQRRVFRQFRKNPDLNAILFLIGIRELGEVRDNWSKEEKQDLMHIAVCRLLSEEGYYELEGLDQEGWPHWEAVKQLPKMSVEQQEKLLKKRIIRYFADL